PVLIERQLVLDLGAVAADGTDPAHGPKLDGAEGVRESAHAVEPRQVEAQAEVRVAVFETGEAGLGDLLEMALNTGRIARDALEDGRNEARSCLVRHDHGEHPLHSRRVESRLGPERRL